jgi:ribonucleoside-diphosphate reductase beta chain
VGVYEGGDGVADRLRQTEEHLNPAFNQLFDELLAERVNRLAADPEDTERLVEAITLYHMIIEGVLALTGQHFIIDYNEREGTLPAFVEGFTKVARDEHRHIAFGVRFLTDMANEDTKYREAIQRTIAESLPVTEKVLDPPWVDDEENWDIFGVSKEETHAFAAQCLSRRLKVIGLVA